MYGPGFPSSEFMITPVAATTLWLPLPGEGLSLMIGPSGLKET
jgi:hypothetical protein